MTSIIDVARECGLSVSTVSRVLNHAQHVNPETTERVMTAVKRLGYQPQRSTQARRAGAVRSIGFVVNRQLLASCGCRSFVRMIGDARWVTLSVGSRISERELRQLKQHYLLDVMLVHSSVQLNYNKTRTRDMGDVILLNQAPPPADFACHRMEFNYTEAVQMAMRHLIRCGHSEIVLLMGGLNETTCTKITGAAREFARQENVWLPQEHILHWDDTKDFFPLETITQNATALICIGTMSMLAFLRCRNENQLDIPRQLMVVAIDDDNFVQDYLPELTSVELNPMECSGFLAGRNSEKGEMPVTVSPQLFIRRSSRCLPLDHEGRRAAGAYALELSGSEQERVLRRASRIGVLFADGQTAFSQLVAQGIREVCAYYNVNLIAIEDARQSHAMHQMQLESLAAQRPDAIISVANDHQPLVRAFMQMANAYGIPLILGTHLPAGLPTEAFRTCIATNDAEKGRAAVQLLAQTMQARGLDRVMQLGQAAAYENYRETDRTAFDFLTHEYASLHLLAMEKGIRPENAAQMLQELFLRYPDVQGLYIHDAQVALRADTLLHKQGKKDCAIVTCQLNRSVAQRMLTEEESNLYGICSSQPYLMGRCLAMAAAEQVLDKELPHFIAVDPICLDRRNVKQMWPQVALSQLL